MNGPVLTLFAAIVAALFVTGALGLLWPNQARGAVGLAGAGLAGLAGTLALVVLLLPGPPAELALPVGLPGAPLSLALDNLSSGFLLLVAFAGSAALVFAAEATPDAPAGSLAAPPLALAGLLLAILAADGVTLALGLAIGGAAIWSIGRPDAPDAAAAEPRAAEPRAAGPRAAGPLAAEPRAAGPLAAGPLAVALLAAASVIVATALLAPGGAGLGFAAIRARPPESDHATLAVLVAIAGLGAWIGLAPLHGWLVPAHRALPAHGSALLSGAMLPAGLYALLRVVLDLGAHAEPAACIVPLLLAGAATVLLGGWRACRDAELDTAVAAGSLRQAGMAAIGLALAVVGRAADLPNLAALALSAVLLLACLQAVCGTLAQLAAGAVIRQAGTRRLDRLGGLIHRMPVTTAGLVIGLGGLAAVPPMPGFAALFLLFQAVLAGPRGGGLGLTLLLTGLVLLLGLGSALATVAAVRLVGTVCLGRPRVLRAAAAAEIPPAARPALFVPAALACLFGVLPGPMLRLLAGPTISDLTGTGLAEHLGWMGLTPNAGSFGYAPLPLTLLLVLSGAGAVWLLRRRARADLRRAPIWQDGFAGARPRLPFGDPLTQWNGAVFLPPLFWARVRPWSIVALWWPRLPRTTGSAVALAAVGMLLALLAWAGRP